MRKPARKSVGPKDDHCGRTFEKEGELTQVLHQHSGHDIYGGFLYQQNASDFCHVKRLSVEDLNQFISANFFYEASGPDGSHPGVQKNKSKENSHYLHTNTPNC